MSTLQLPEYRALAEFRYQIRKFLSFSEQAARNAGLEPQQHQLLLACKGLPSNQRPTIGTLAARLCVAHHTAVALVDKLEKNEMIARTPSKDDRREVLVAISPRGETVLAELSALHRHQLSTVAPALCRALDLIVAKQQPKAPALATGARARRAAKRQPVRKTIGPK